MKDTTILSFFASAPKDSQGSQGSRPSVPVPPPPPNLPLSPLPIRAPRDRGAIVSASDDDDDDDDALSSDDDLPNLFAKPRSDAVPVRSRVGESNPFITPRSKRSAVSGLQSSPAAIMPKHKFDMEALLSHAKSHDAAEANAQRVSDLLSDGDSAAESARANKPVTSLYETMMDVWSDTEDEEKGAGRKKLLRAMKRTEAAVDRKSWRFFQQSADASPPHKRSLFPRQSARAGWAFLAAPCARQHVFGDGLVYAIQCKRQDLPDEVVQWILDEIPAEESAPLRQEYGRLLGVCRKQVHRLLDEDGLDRIFQSIGASAEALDPTARVSGVIETDHPYADRAWSLLRSVLNLLSRTSDALSQTSLTHAVSILLRLGVDTLVVENIDVRKDYSDAIGSLISAVPTTYWTRFCEDVCSSFLKFVNEVSLCWNALAVLPAANPRVVELRRRLALVCFFDDPGLGRWHPDDHLSIIPAITGRLDDDAFSIRRETDYYSLAALALVLTIAIGDGCPPPPSASPEAARQFDQDVDQLCKRIKRVWSAVDTGGAAYVSRFEAKTAWQNLQKLLQYVVRTRPPPKTGILDEAWDREDPFQPRQRKLMTEFFTKAIPAGSAE